MIKPYKDFFGRTQYSVAGPKGRYLVTRKNERESWEIWRSDSIRTASTARTLKQALARAEGYAGISG